MKILIILFYTLFYTFLSKAEKEIKMLQIKDSIPRVSLQYKADFILQQVAQMMRVSLKDIYPLPEVILQKNADLALYSSELTEQWGFDPKVLTNVYVVKKNKIYLIDEKAYYEKAGRCIDDSLAHELVHYIQVKYQKIDVSDFDDSMEMTAIEIQTQFREKFCFKMRKK
ncbi:MAG: hypothetical protein L6Q37_06700 [Bdellovibrionaceae bacterium]|nr:hypothetical protein [Pseudobdellovibrionaceae bacterium]NUM58639.1 hypothetical protein [Pseudobdellovibrionaceae bacterium]